MLRQTKIQYHYYFPNLPINDNDIQALYEKMNDILWMAEMYICELNHQKMHLPKIFISDDIVTKTYGKYDYKAILKEIKKFNEKFPYSYFCEILEQLENTIKGKPLIDEPITVLYTLLKEISKQRKSCWRKTYELLERLDNNPKMIYLRP